MSEPEKGIDATPAQKFTPKVVKNIPEKKKRRRIIEYSVTIEFVKNAGGQWVLVAEKKNPSTAHSAARRWREEAGNEFEAVVRGSNVYMRLIVIDKDNDN